jgi:mannose-1-phosphate guanylyltransferase / mannose-6-phosphate isomerase
MADTPLYITPIILAGGSGERLWPLSKTDYPKQFASFSSDGKDQGSSLFQDSLLRVSNRDLFSAPIILCNEDHRFIVTEQLRHMGVHDATILIEPVARNTAPALALAALHMEQSGNPGIMLVMPSDHRIDLPQQFVSAIRHAAPATMGGWLVTFGVTPDAPETGYGYIKSGAVLNHFAPLCQIECFVEKPDRATAQSYLDAGGYAWNSGIFLMHSTHALNELMQYNPDIVTACRAAYAGHHIDQSFLRMDKQAMTSCPSISIDYAIMEHTQKGAVIAVDMAWCDLGSWTSICNLSDKDEQNNASIGRVVMVDSHDCYMRTHNALIAAIGVRDLVVVSADNAILIGPKDRMQDIKQLVAKMRDQHLPDTMLTSFSHRPWGSFYSIDKGTRYQVKRLLLKPGGKISLQTHEKRSEHWVVVQGKATVTNGDEVKTLEANQSTYIPAGTRHRLENRENEELIVIEVQTGSYLGEDDITRFEDVYNRDC